MFIGEPRTSGLRAGPAKSDNGGPDYVRGEMSTASFRIFATVLNLIFPYLGNYFLLGDNFREYVTLIVFIAVLFFLAELIPEHGNEAVNTIMGAALMLTLFIIVVSGYIHSIRVIFSKGNEIKISDSEFSRRNIKSIPLYIVTCWLSLNLLILYHYVWFC